MPLAIKSLVVDYTMTLITTSQLRRNWAEDSMLHFLKESRVITSGCPDGHKHF